MRIKEIIAEMDQIIEITDAFGTEGFDVKALLEVMKIWRNDLIIVVN